ncbi:hypothetical protein QBC33DRAFT_383467 [Phialemonium atrogriseum]|uniref:RING-type E3 ubiquitin transferase n=1 Tax=Phialemonium atrogriseum TaxID=1093897 RepID=A0AAJ0FHH1_9PEZI|nr:uncharacterized protein QBC33DRAFT_383467 [Phialemonium atrogriseum]KAK1768581.1 hypothetical protein QBC33DRAFT_383467 [Phialemonium atrogriseum]
MFTQSAAVPTSPGFIGSTTTVTTSPASPTSRTSRLRGLSYLRNYTQTHLLSREQSPQHQQQNQNQHQHHSAASPSAISNHNPNPFDSSSHSSFTNPIDLARSASDSPLASTATTNPPPARSSRFSLLTPGSHPLASPLEPSRSAPSPTVAAGEESTVSTDRTTEQASSAASSAGPAATTMTRTRSATACDVVRSNSSANIDVLPSIRFSTFYDPRAPRPSLTFTPVSRTLPTGSEVIRVGRYSERDSQPNIPPNIPSAAPVGFKSKVVSRRHCEFWYEDGKWFIKDVKSSSGTFLNHIRLSPPGTESKPFPINDGDIVQLGIDFKGGEEMIFRCVKMRLELNRGWQSKLNTFNMTTHKRLRNMTASSGNGAAEQSYSQDCSICLNSIAPCQCLFVAPCSHTWHYKCIRSLLSSPSYPIFICPNCRAAADLEAEVEDPEEWEQLDSDDAGNDQAGGAELAVVDSGTSSGTSVPAATAPRKSREPSMGVLILRQSAALAAASAPPAQAQPPPPDPMDVTMQLDSPPQEEEEEEEEEEEMPDHHPADRPDTPPSDAADNLAPYGTPVSHHATSDPVPIPSSAAAAAAARTPSPTTTGTANGRANANATALSGPEGPITPRNDAGPWVFDGSGVRMRGGEAAAVGHGHGHGRAQALAQAQVISLDAAANGDGMDLNGA